MERQLRKRWHLVQTQQTVFILLVRIRLASALVERSVSRLMEAVTSRSLVILTVSGATTTVESTTVTIDDKNIELGSVATPTDTTADGGGITLKGATDKTIKWINSTGYWTFNTGIDVGGNIASGKEFNIAGTANLSRWQPVTSAIECCLKAQA